ncbi:hypothetical protein ACH4S8_44525 [Streptomyces sp. NPDC021080]|uniref:hypothetical protein n=1 Tax=Streptomyces sp. NPDC021080 TaxID=3365110 RepID=UPI003796FC5E
MDELVTLPEPPAAVPAALDAAPEAPSVTPEEPGAPKQQGARKPFLLGAVTGAAVTAVVMGGIGLLMDDSESGGSSKAASSYSAAPAEDDAKAADASDDETQEVYNTDPSPDDFELTLKTTQKQCFGSAGCNVTVEPNLAYASVIPLDPDATISITYEIRGDESGAITQTMELTDQTQLSYHETALSTGSSGVKVIARVTDVETSS